MFWLQDVKTLTLPGDALACAADKNRAARAETDCGYSCHRFGYYVARCIM
jgi:hypothetical protein